MEKIFNVRTVEPETLVCDCEKKLDNEDEKPLGANDFDLLHDSTSSFDLLTSSFEESAKVRRFIVMFCKIQAVLSQHMADNNFDPISEDDAEVLAKVIREKAISTKGGNIGRSPLKLDNILWIENVLSPIKKSSQIDLSFLRPLIFFMLPALKSVICPNPTRNRWMSIFKYRRYYIVFINNRHLCFTDNRKLGELQSLQFTGKI